MKCKNRRQAAAATSPEESLLSSLHNLQLKSCRFDSRAATAADAVRRPPFRKRCEPETTTLSHPHAQ